MKLQTALCNKQNNEIFKVWEKIYNFNIFIRKAILYRSWQLEHPPVIVFFLEQRSGNSLLTYEI